MAKQFKTTSARQKPFSVVFLEGLKPAERPFEISEPGGLRVVVGKRTKTFILRYVSPQTKKPRKLTIGRFPAKTLAEARLELAAARQLIDLGSDPAGLRLEAKRVKQTAPTVEELAKEYLRWLPAKRSREEDEYYIGQIVKRWGLVKVWAVQRRDVLAMMDEQGDKLVTASRLLIHTRKLFAFALDREFVENNPAVGVKSKGGFRKRSRFLTDDEIKLFWAGSAAMTGGKQPGMMLRLELVTGQRQGEIRRMQKDQLDLAKGLWTIPETIAKNKRAHVVPLSALASQIIRTALQASKDSAYVFPGRGGGPTAKGTLGQAVRRNSEALPFDDFRPHDLRRTCATELGALGIPRLIIEKVLNHSDRTVTAVYDRWGYLEEKTAALNKWGTRLSLLVDNTSTTGQLRLIS